MISHDKKLVFIHIPKCAGCSINKAFGLKVHAGTGHAGWKGHAPFIKKGYFCFTYVRNPWDRIVSLYHYFFNMKQGHQWYGQNHKLANIVGELDFKEFCERLDEFQKCGWSGIHFVPACNFLRNMKNEINLDFIGRFEHIKEDFIKLCDKLGLKQQSLPHSNRSQHRNYTEYYNDETKQIVETKYKKDIEQFDYAFGE